MMDPQIEEEYIDALSEHLGLEKDFDAPDFDQLVQTSRAKKRGGEILADKKRVHNRKKNALSKKARRINRKK